MKNRWSDAARTAALAVRQARSMAARPVKQPPIPKRGRTAPKPMVKKPAAKGSGRNNPGPHIWMPPRDDPRHPLAGGATGIPEPNIFYSSSYPFGPGQEGRLGILRYDPSWPDMAADLGYNMGPEYEKRRKRQGLPVPVRTRVIIGGKRYTRVGGKLVPDTSIPGVKMRYGK
jgi:hypothetical protein